MANPELSSWEQPVLWRADVDCNVVPIVAADSVDMPLWGQPVILHPHHITYARQQGTFWYLILSSHIKAVYCGMDTYLDTPLMIPLCVTDSAMDRLVGVDNFLRYLLHGQIKLIDNRLTAQQQQRLIRMLQAIDAWQKGISTREIARAIFGERFLSSGVEWKTSSIRSRVLSLVKDGKRMLDGGYLKLLQPRHRERH